MGWLDDTVASYSNPNNYVKNAMTLGTYSAVAGENEARGRDNDRKNAAIDQGIAGSYSGNPRDADFDKGMARGKEIFYNDPDMQTMKARREDLSKGYNGAELGSLRENARQDLEGQRSKYIANLHSQAGRGGVGGARAAAMEGAANQGFAGQRATNERAMNMDQAKMVRQGTGDLQDFLMRQKYGQLGTALGEEQLGVADRGAQAQAAIAGKEPKKGLLGDLFSGLF